MSARLQTFTVTLDGTVQQLSASAQDGPIRVVSVQPDTANSAAAYVGGSAVASTEFMVRLPVPVSNEPCAPWILDGFEGGWLYLSDLYVKGTANDKLHIGIVRAI